MRYCWIVSIIAGGSLHAAILLQNSGQVSVQYNISAVENISTSFIFTNTFTNVGISTSLDKGLNNTGIPRSGSAYLTTAIGPGTSTSSQIATTTFIFPTTPTVFQLFSGLTLPSGTYFLTLGSPDSVGGGWDATTIGTLTQTTSPGANFGTNYFANSGNQNTVYPPGSQFTAGLVYTPLFTVTGTPSTTSSVPEPSSLIMIVSGMFLWLKKCQFRQTTD